MSDIDQKENRSQEWQGIWEDVNAHLAKPVSCTLVKDDNESLRAENKRLREALENISRMDKSGAEIYMSERTRLAGCIHQANKALKGTEK